jgi:hypothetical protein
MFNDRTAIQADDSSAENSISKNPITDNHLIHGQLGENRRALSQKYAHRKGNKGGSKNTSKRRTKTPRPTPNCNDKSPMRQKMA